MSAIQLTAASTQAPAQIDNFPKKPLSMTVHEIAIPVLKVLAVILVSAPMLTLIAAIGINSLPLFFVGIISMSVGALLMCVVINKFDAMEKGSKAPKDPQWIAYYSEKLKNVSIEELKNEVDSSVWPDLNWSGEVWKEKILPHARAHQMDRESLEKQFPTVFSLFDSKLRDYYRETELPLLQNEGFKAFMQKAGRFPLTVTNEELRAALLKETADLSCKEAIERVGEVPFYQGHLKAEEFRERFEKETQHWPLVSIYQEFGPDLLVKGLLTGDRLASLLDDTLAVRSDLTYSDIEKRYKGLTRHEAWFQSPRLQQLWLKMASAPDFRFTESSLCDRFEPEQIAVLPQDLSKLIQELRSEKTKIMAPSKGHAEAKALYGNEPYWIQEEVDRTRGRHIEYRMEYVDNLKKQEFEQEWKSWQRADRLYQERMLPELDEKARQKFVELIKARAN